MICVFDACVCPCTVANMASSAGRQARGPGSVHHQLPVLHRMGAHIRGAIRLTRQNVRTLCLRIR